MAPPHALTNGVNVGASVRDLEERVGCIRVLLLDLFNFMGNHISLIFFYHFIPNKNFLLLFYFLIDIYYSCIFFSFFFFFLPHNNKGEGGNGNQHHTLVLKRHVYSRSSVCHDYS